MGTSAGGRPAGGGGGPTAPPLFGTEFSTAINFVPSAPTANGPAAALTYLSLASAGAPIVLNPAGLYMLATTFIISGDQAQTEFWVDLEFSGAPTGVPPSKEQLSVAGGTAQRTTLIPFPGAAYPALWLNLKYAKNGGPGVVTMITASLNLWRVG
jgi:hypothetical protein